MKELPLDKAYPFMFNPLPGTELYEEAIAKGLFKQEDLYHVNYALTGITTEEFNPEMIRKLQHQVYWYYTFRPLWRDPKKFFFKYVRRILTVQSLKVLWRIAKTLTTIFNRKKAATLTENLNQAE